MTFQSAFSSNCRQRLLEQLANESGHNLADPALVRWQISRWKNDLVAPQAAICMGLSLREVDDK